MKRYLLTDAQSAAYSELASAGEIYMFGPSEAFSQAMGELVKMGIVSVTDRMSWVASSEEPGKEPEEQIEEQIFEDYFSQFEVKRYCLWKREEHHDFYETDCGQAYSLLAGSLKDNHINFCHFCGKEIFIVALRAQISKLSGKEPGEGVKL